MLALRLVRPISPQLRQLNGQPFMQSGGSHIEGNTVYCAGFMCNELCNELC